MSDATLAEYDLHATATLTTNAWQTISLELFSYLCISIIRNRRSYTLLKEIIHHLKSSEERTLCFLCLYDINKSLMDIQLSCCRCFLLGGLHPVKVLLFPVWIKCLSNMYVSEKADANCLKNYMKHDYHY